MTRLNILVEKVNGLGLTQMQQSDVVRKILSVLPIDTYGHIVTVLHQGDLSTATPTQILGKINAHEMYMHITPQDGSSSTKKKEKDLAFKASQDKGKARLEYESSSDEEDEDEVLLGFGSVDHIVPLPCIIKPRQNFILLLYLFPFFLFCLT